MKLFKNANLKPQSQRSISMNNLTPYASVDRLFIKHEMNLFMRELTFNIPTQSFFIMD